MLDSFKCPLSREVMENPVVAADGHSYDFKSISKHLETSNISPITGLEMGPALVPNHTLRKAIQEYTDLNKLQKVPSRGASKSHRLTMSPRSPPISRTTSPPIRTQSPIKNSPRIVEELRYSPRMGSPKFPEILPEIGLFYYEAARETQIFRFPDLESVQEVLYAGQPIVAEEKVYNSNAQLIVRLQDGGYILERDIVSKQMETGLFVFKILASSLQMRTRPDSSAPRKDKKLDQGQLVSGEKMIINKRGQRWLLLNDSKMWVPDREDGVEIMERIEPEKSAWIFEILQPGGIAIRKWPDVKKEFRHSNKIMITEGKFVKSNYCVQGQSGDWLYYIHYNGITGWLFSSIEGEKTMYSWSKAPQPICTEKPGEAIYIACGYESWITVSNAESMFKEKTQIINWSNLPTGMARQMDICIEKKRNVDKFAYGIDNIGWYISASNLDGSKESWGTIYPLEPDCVVSLADDEERFVIVFADGEFRFDHVPDELLDRIETSKKVERISLGTDDSFFIRDERGSFFNVKDKSLKKCLQSTDPSDRILFIGFFRDGKWVVIRDYTFSCSQGVPDDMKEAIEEHYVGHLQSREEQELRIKEYNSLL